MRLFALLLTTLLLAGAGCLKPVEPTVLPDQPDRESENMVGEIEITTAIIEKDFVLNEFASCTVDIASPNFQTASLSNTQQLQLEREVSHFIATALGSDADIESPAELDALADDYLDRCQNEITTEYNDLSSAGEELFTNLKRSVEVVYAVKLNDHGLLSFGLDEYSYSGGAHPNQRSMYLTADRQSGELVILGDLIAPEHLKVFLQYEYAKLLTENRENLYPESAADFDALIENTESMPAEAQFGSFAHINNFFLTPTSIVAYFNSYDIAPYAAGPIFVEMPYSEIAAFIDPNGPLAPLLENGL
jgi:hypothetical protein